MTNLIISLVYLILSFTFTIWIFKTFGKYGLIIWMSVIVVMCNIQTIKMSELFGLTISLGNISYGAIFLSTDILSEKYGKEDAKTATRLSFIMMVAFTIFMQLFLLYKPSSVDFSQDALKVIFGSLGRITVGSLLAYYTSQICDAKIYSYLKDKYHTVWISNNVSTLISQIVDTLIFVTIAFIGTMSFKDLTSLIVTMILFKFIIAFLDTPFMMLVTKMKNKEIE